MSDTESGSECVWEYVCCTVADTFLFALSVVGTTLARLVCACAHVLFAAPSIYGFVPVLECVSNFLATIVCSFCFQIFEHDWCDLNAAAIRFLWFSFFRLKKSGQCFIYTFNWNEFELEINANMVWKHPHSLFHCSHQHQKTHHHHHQQ